MDRMEFEKIKHEAAHEVFDGTEYNWMDALDQTADEERFVKTLDEDMQKDYWIKFFEDTLEDLRWEDRKEQCDH